MGDPVTGEVFNLTFDHHHDRDLDVMIALTASAEEAKAAGSEYAQARLIWHRPSPSCWAAPLPGKGGTLHVTRMPLPYRFTPPRKELT